MARRHKIRPRRSRNPAPRSSKDDSIRYYPIFINLEAQPVVVVGGGPIALRKVQGLLACGARIRIISPRLTSRLQSMARQGKIRWHRRTCRRQDLRGARLVFIATADPSINQTILDWAGRQGILANVSNLPEQSCFLVPSVVRRGDLSIAVSTSGQSPALAKYIRRELKRLFGPEFAAYVALLGRVRRTVRVKLRSASKRQQVSRRLVRPALIQWVRSGKKGETKRRAGQIAGLEGQDV